jgi:nicotinamidase-related amidase
MRILKEQAIGLVIDIQERLFPFIYEHEALARNAGILVQGLQAIGLPILVTEQYTKGLGPTVPELRPLLPGEVIEKMAFSCCDEPAFRAALAESGRKFVIITGIEAHVCVLQTAIDLLELNYVPVIVEDCVSSRRLNDKQQAIARMRKSGAIVSTYESVLFELLRYSGTDEFRAISKLVK